MSNPGFIKFQHVFFLTTLAVSVAIGPSYTSAAYVAIILLHCCYHDTRLAFNEENGKTIIRLSPNSWVCLSAGIIAFGHLVAVGVCNAMGKESDLWEGFGIYKHIHLDRMLRHTIPDVFIVIASVMKYSAQTGSATARYFIVGQPAAESDPLIETDLEAVTDNSQRKLSPLSIPVLTIASGGVTVLWPRVMTSVYLAIFLGTVSYWGLVSSTRRLPPSTIQDMTFFMWALSTISIVIQFSSNMLIFKTFVEDNIDTLNWIGVRRFDSFEDLFYTSTGRQYAAHCGVLAFIYFLSWHSAFVALSKNSCQRLQIIEGSSEENDEVARLEEVNYEFRNLMGEENDDCQSEQPEQDIQMNTRKNVDTGIPNSPSQSEIIWSSEQQQIPTVRTSTEIAMDDVVIIETPRSDISITAKQTSVGTILVRYSPHLLCIVLGLTAILDPSFLSAVWLVSLILFVYYALNSNIDTIIKGLPFAIVWSAMHVIAIYVVSIPGVVESDSKYIDKLSAVGVARHGGSTLVLTAHGCLMLLIAIVKKFSKLTAAKKEGLSETRSSLSQNSNPTLAYVKDWLLSRAQFITLLILVVVGCLHIDLIQSSFILFFVIFATSPKIAQKYWKVLLTWEIIVTLFLYNYNVAMKGWNEPDTLGKLSWRTIVAEPFDSMWELTPYLLLIFFSIWQLIVFQNQDDGIVTNTILPPNVARLRASVSLAAVWLGLLLVTLLTNPTLMTAGYFFLFIWVAIVIEMRNGGTRKQLIVAWGFGLVYSATCFISLYLYQFSSMADIFAEVFNAILSCEGGVNKTQTDCVHETGFRTYEKVSTRVEALLPHWVIFSLIVYQITCIRRVWSLAEQESSVHDDDNNNGNQVDRGMLEIPKKVQEMYAVGIQFCRRLIIVMCGSALPYVLLLVLWIAASQERSVLCAGYHVLLVILIFWPSVKLAKVIAIYSVLSVVSKFWYQYSFFPSFLSDSSATYFGVFPFDSTWEECVHCSIKDQTWTDLLVWVCSLFFMRARRWAKDDMQAAKANGSVSKDCSTLNYIWNLTIFIHDDSDEVVITERPVSKHREVTITYPYQSQIDLRECEVLVSATCNAEDRTHDVSCIIQENPEFLLSSSFGFEAENNPELCVSYIRRETTCEKTISMAAYIAGYSLKQLKHAIDYSIRKWSLELLMFIMLVVAASNPYIFESFIYLGLVLYLRHRQRDSHVVPVIVICALLFCVREFFYIGMPVQHLWGPFVGRDKLSTTAWEFWSYFGSYPNRTDTFASATVLVVSLYHYRVVHIMNIKTEIKQPYGTSTLTQFLDQTVSYKGNDMLRREALIKMTASRESMESLKEMLPEPDCDDLINTPVNWRRRILGYWMKYLPYWCLFFVFIDATAAEFITLLRMGKLAVAMILLKEWDHMLWRGNALWKYINDYFLFCLVFHMIFNIPKLATAWEDNNSLAKLYSFLGIIECTWVDKKCIGSLIQVNFWEVTIMCLLYLQRVNYEKFDSVFLMYEAHRYRLNASSICDLISERLDDRVQKGKKKAEATQEERTRILESTKREPKQLVNPVEKKPFSTLEYYEDGSTSEEDKLLRSRKREAYCKGYLLGGRFNDAYNVDSSNMAGRGQRQELVTSFREGKSKKLILTETLPENGTIEDKTSILMLALNHPPGSIGILDSSLTTQQLDITSKLEVIAESEGQVPQEKTKQSKIVKLAKYFHDVALLGEKDISDADITSKPWTYLNSGATLYLKEHSDKICFVIFAVNFSVSVSILDMVTSMSVFVYALLVHPRPNAYFWNYALTYMMCLLALKCVVQAIEVTFGDFLPSALDTFTSSIGSTSFFANVLGDYCAIVAITARKAVLRSWGLDNTEDNTLKRHGSQLSKATSHSRHSRLSRHSQSPPAKPFSQKLIEIFNDYMKNVTSPEGKIGRTHDLYIPSFSVDLLCLILFIGLYSKVGDNKNFDLGEAISQNLLPGALVLGMIIIVVCMVIDRIIYLCDSVTNKLCMQWILVLAYHIGYFVWYQAYNENGKSGHAAGAVLFITRALWLAISAKQIDFGYPAVRRHDCFTHSDNQYIFLVYTALRAIPFLWELRVLLDWACANTTLKLAYWLKLEDLRNEVYARKMDIIDNQVVNPENKPGEKLPLMKVCFFYVFYYVSLFITSL